MANGIDLSDTKTQRTIIIILLGIISAGLIWWFMIKPQTEKLSSLKETTKQKQEELNKILTLIPQLEQMRIDVVKLREEMDSLEAIFPAKPDVPGLITSITEVARAQGVAIVNFRPAKTQTLAKEFYVENYYEMSVMGSYHNIGKFFAQIANFDLLVNIDRINAKTSSTLADDLKVFDEYNGTKSADELIRSVLTSFRITTYSSLQGQGAKTK